MSFPLLTRRAALLTPPWVRNELWRRARAMPSLDLPFAESKRLVDAVSGRQLVDFTRASSGTFVGSDGLIKTAAVNEPRFTHDPVTGESLGLLVEEARANLLTYSEQFENSAWTKANAAVTSNATTAPDGTLTADLLYTTTSGFANAGRTLGSVSSARYTTTIYLKSAGFTWAFVYGAQGNNKAYFNLSTGTVGTLDAGITASISPVGNGWYRCSVTQTVTDTNFYVGPANANGSTTSTASGTSGIFVWGAQLEAGDIATSYISTTTSTVTRSADVASITGTNFSSWYRQDEGTLLIDSAIDYTVPADRFPFVASLNDSTSNNVINAGFLTANIAGLEVSTGGTLQVNQYAGAASLRRRLAITYRADDFAVCVNGGPISADTAGIVPIVNSLRIGDRFGSSALNGPIRRLTYWPRRFDYFTLQELTR